MNTFHDYESLGSIQNIEEAQAPVLETLSGSAVVSWYTMIEDFLQRKLDDQEAARNHENADRLRALLNTWRDNELTGSISIDQLRPLKAAVEQGAAVKSSLRPIFTSILRNLRKLIADEEQLPRGVDQNAVNPMGAGLGRGAPPMSPDFGPEDEAPGELGGNKPGEEDELNPAGLEQPGDEAGGANKVIDAVESLQRTTLNEDAQTDLARLNEVVALFDKQKPAAGENYDTYFAAFKTFLKNRVEDNVRDRVMCVYLFKRIYLEGVDQNTAYQKWVVAEPRLRQEYMTDPAMARFPNMWDKQ